MLSCTPGSQVDLFDKRLRMMRLQKRAEAKRTEHEDRVMENFVRIYPDEHSQAFDEILEKVAKLDGCETMMRTEKGMKSVQDALQKDVDKEIQERGMPLPSASNGRKTMGSQPQQQNQRKQGGKSKPPNLLTVARAERKANEKEFEDAVRRAREANSGVYRLAPDYSTNIYHRAAAPPPSPPSPSQLYAAHQHQHHQFPAHGHHHSRGREPEFLMESRGQLYYHQQQQGPVHAFEPPHLSYQRQMRGLDLEQSQQNSSVEPRYHYSQPTNRSTDAGALISTVSSEVWYHPEENMYYSPHGKMTEQDFEEYLRLKHVDTVSGRLSHRKALSDSGVGQVDSQVDSQTDDSNRTELQLQERASSRAYLDEAELNVQRIDSELTRVLDTLRLHSNRRKNADKGTRQQQRLHMPPSRSSSNGGTEQASGAPSSFENIRLGTSSISGERPPPGSRSQPSGYALSSTYTLPVGVPNMRSAGGAVPSPLVRAHSGAGGFLTKNVGAVLEPQLIPSSIRPQEGQQQYLTSSGSVMPLRPLAPPGVPNSVDPSAPPPRLVHSRAGSADSVYRSTKEGVLPLSSNPSSGLWNFGGGTGVASQRANSASRPSAAVAPQVQYRGGADGSNASSVGPAERQGSSSASRRPGEPPRSLSEQMQALHNQHDPSRDYRFTQHQQQPSSRGSQPAMRGNMLTRPGVLLPPAQHQQQQQYHPNSRGGGGSYQLLGFGGRER